MLSLSDALSWERRHWASRISPPASTLLEADLERLRRSELPERALDCGERAPNFRLPDPIGKPVELDTLLGRGPVVLVFYRGGWCPYCNLTLRAYQHRLRDIEVASATLIAVSPQRPDRSLSTAERNALAFPVLSDTGSAIARAYGLAFDLDADMQQLYAEVFGHDLTRYNGDGAGGGWTLPLPATYVINRQARIELASVEVDYRERLDHGHVVEHLRHLRDAA